MNDYADYQKRGEWKDYSLGHYPEMPRQLRPWVALGLFAVLAIGTTLGYLTGYFLVCFIVAVVFAMVLYSWVFPLRCPQCKGRVLTRLEDSKQDGQDYRQFFHDCPKCEVTWIDKKHRVSDS